MFFFFAFVKLNGNTLIFCLNLLQSLAKTLEDQVPDKSTKLLQLWTLEPKARGLIVSSSYWAELCSECILFPFHTSVFIPEALQTPLFSPPEGTRRALPLKLCWQNTWEFVNLLNTMYNITIICNLANREWSRNICPFLWICSHSM